MFTFIVPSVRKGSLEYAVDSVINQTYTNWLAIVAGDGCYVPAFEDERILSIIAPPRRDASQVRMYAAKYVTTEWVVFLDDDDWVEPDYLEKFIPFMPENDIIISQMNNYGHAIPSGHFIEHGSVGIAFAIRTEVLLENPLPPPPSEDYVYLKRMLDKGFRIAYTDYCGYVVRRYLSDPNFVSAI